jgi:hypothetical protein
MERRLAALEALHPELGLPIHPPLTGSPRKPEARVAGEGPRAKINEGEAR